MDANQTNTLSEFLRVVPPWAIVGLLFLLVVIIGVAVLRGQAVELWILKISPRQKKKRENEGTLRAARSESLSSVEVINVANLGPTLLRILLERKKETTFIRSEVRILAADGADLVSHLKAVVEDTRLRNTSFEFAIVNPDFDRIDEGAPGFRSGAQTSLARLEGLRKYPGLGSGVTIKPTRTYRFFPNIWGALVNNSVLLIGFHNWVDREGRQVLEGTQHGIIHLESDHSLFDRFASLFVSWYEQSDVEDWATN